MVCPFTFIGGLLVFFILQSATANCFECYFYNTVNITASQQLSNGSYRYKDILVPKHMTVDFNYIVSERGIIDMVPVHKRGCVCQLKPCIWICCRYKDTGPNGECNDGLMETLTEINPCLNVTLRNGTVAKRYLLNEFLVLRHTIRLGEWWTDSVYKLFENGSVLHRGFPPGMSRGYDCIHPNQFSSGDSSESFVVAIHRNGSKPKPSVMLPEEKMLICLSEVFLVLTIVVYLYVKKLRNLHGKCFICYMIISFLHIIHASLTFVSVPVQLCSLIGYCQYFLDMCKFAWLLSLTHQMWKGFTSTNRLDSQHSFLAYSTFSWSTPAILTGFVFLIDRIWEDEPKRVDWIPAVGWESCYLRPDWSYIIYFQGPFFTLIALNSFLFLWTIISIVRVKLSLSYFVDQDERAKIPTSSEMPPYKMFLRLCIIMDLQWSVRIISYLADFEHLIRICDYCDHSIGIIIFVLFILKRSTIRLVIERIRSNK